VGPGVSNPGVRRALEMHIPLLADPQDIDAVTREAETALYLVQLPSELTISDLLQHNNNTNHTTNNNTRTSAENQPTHQSTHSNNNHHSDDIMNNNNNQSNNNNNNNNQQALFRPLVDQYGRLGKLKILYNIYIYIYIYIYYLI
jgi:hypothetical protein